ncbi:MAG: LmeA family phospholipid-binding protein [Pseudonocardiaceae bacterium]
MRKLIIAVLVIVVLAVGADFGAAAAAEYTVAKQMRQQLHLASDPSVRINGFPFLTQAVAGHYTAIDVQASGVAADPLHDLDVAATLHDVDAPLSEVISGDLHSVRAARVDGQVRIKDADLGRAIGMEDLRIQQPSDQEIKDLLPPGTPTSDSPQGTRAPIKMVATTDLVGQRTEVVAFGVIALTSGLVRITTSDVRVTGIDAVGLPQAARQTLLSTLSTDVKTGGLPFAVTPTRIWVETGSIVVEGTANNVSLRQAGVAVGLRHFTPAVGRRPGREAGRESWSAQTPSLR